jgi:hypothetical protein
VKLMVDEAQPQGAPSAPPMVAPAAPAEATPKRRRRKAATSGNGTGRRGGRRKLTDAEKAQAAADREQAAREREQTQANRIEARRAMSRLAAIGALTPDLLSADEIAGLSKFVLAMMQQQPPAEAQP